MKKEGRLIFLILFCQGLLLSGCRNSSEKKEGDTESILENPPYSAITDSIRKFPDDAALYFRRAELLSKNNIHEIAIGDYKKSWELDPEETTGLRFASDLSIAGRPQDAMKFLQNAVQHFPSSKEFKRLLGDAFMQDGKAKEALDLYQSLLKKDSADFESWYEVGLLYEQLKDTASAIGALKKAYGIQPVDTYALELAHMYAECKNAEAIKICDAIIRRDSSREWVDPFFIKGIYYSNKQQFSMAIVQFDSCVQRDWKFTDAYIEKGIALFKQRNFDRALHTFQMAATVSNTSPDAYYWIGRCYEATSKKDEAILNYERALALDRNFLEAIEAIKRLKG